MKIEATGRGEILIRLDLDEAWAALEKESVGINPRLLEGVLRREDEMQVDMAAQAARNGYRLFQHKPGCRWGDSKDGPCTCGPTPTAGGGQC